MADAPDISTEEVAVDLDSMLMLADTFFPTDESQFANFQLTDDPLLPPDNIQHFQADLDPMETAHQKYPQDDPSSIGNIPGKTTSSRVFQVHKLKNKIFSWNRYLLPFNRGKPQHP
jgi:hypothetical protein